MLRLACTHSFSFAQSPSRSRARTYYLLNQTPPSRSCLLSNVRTRSLSLIHNRFRSFPLAFAHSRSPRPILLTNTPSQLQKLLFACTRFLLARARFLLFGFAFLARAHSITHMHVPSRLHPPLLAHARLLSIAQAPSCSFMLPFAHAHFLPFRLCTLPLAHTYSSGYHALLLAHICSQLFRTRSLMIAEAPSCSHLFLY